jgi:hypothetical protein
MPQRAILIVVDSPALDFSAQWEQLAARSLHGELTFDDAARAALFNPGWLHAIASARLSKILIGNEWRETTPARFRCIALGEEGEHWRCTPASAQPRVERLLQDAKIPAAAPIASHRIAAAALLAENEPWDFLTVCLPIPSAGSADAIAQDLASCLTRQPADAAIVALLLAGANSRWLCHTPGAAAAAGSAQSIQNIIATVLSALNVQPPESLQGTPIKIGAAASNPYSVEDEREIQKRLEDLGYL